MSVGIAVRHQRTCPARDGERCSCRPSYQAAVWSAPERRRIRRTFPTLAAARAWRADAQTQVRRGTMRAPTKQTVRAAAEAFLAGARDGSIATRSGQHYKASTVRNHRSVLEQHVLPALGGERLSRVTVDDVQGLVDRLARSGLSGASIRAIIQPLGILFRRARRHVPVNPCDGLEFPGGARRRERIAAPAEAAALIGALPPGDRAVWATALYAGLRLGELQGLRWADVDLAAGVIRVEQAWDPKGRAMIDPKSRAGRRRVPVAGALRDLLLEHRLATGARELAFARADGRPFHANSLRDRARRVWRAAGLEPIGWHECRHSAASLLIDSGLNAKAISTFMGHSSIQVTFDRYGHLMPGSEAEATARLDALLAAAAGQVRAAEAPGTVAPTVAQPGSA